MGVEMPAAEKISLQDLNPPAPARNGTPAKGRWGGVNGDDHHGGRVKASRPQSRKISLLDLHPSDATFREGFARLAPLNLSFDAWFYHPQIGDVRGLAQAFPDTRICLNHVGGPLGICIYGGKRDEVFSHGSAAIRALANCPNVFVKLGGLAMRINGFDFHEKTIPPMARQPKFVHSAILSSDRDNHSITGRLVLDLLGAGEHVPAHMRKYYTFGSDFRQMLRKCRVIQMEFHLPVVEVTFSDKEVGTLRSFGKGVHPFGVT
jgi:hypothetical protein